MTEQLSPIEESIATLHRAIRVNAVVAVASVLSFAALCYAVDTGKWWAQHPWVTIAMQAINAASAYEAARGVMSYRSVLRTMRKIERDM